MTLSGTTSRSNTSGTADTARARRVTRTSAAERNRRKRKRITTGILLVLGIVVLFGLSQMGTALWTVLRGIRTELTEQVPVPKPGQNINVLFLGLDVVIKADGTVDLDTPLRSSRSRTDTMILISVDPETNVAALISIPRDSRVTIPGRGIDKINAAHVYGGPQLAMQTVGNLLGIDVHYYVRTNYAGVQAIVDSVGGVEINVESAMKYTDPYQNLYIDLEKGLQVLDGDKALQFLRYRSDGGDIKRIARQQQFIGALIRKVTSFSTVFRAQSLAREVVKFIDTNMATADMWQFISVAAKINDPSLEMVTLPGDARDIKDEGRPTLSYWVLDDDGTEDIVDRLVWGIDKEGNAGITVRVLNGSGVSGMAARMARQLEGDGFKIVEVANASDSDKTTTFVISHTTDNTVSDRVVRSLMRYTPEVEVVREMIAEPPCNITIIVGKDFSLAQK
jgi:LCP family protein required for cell wall assembly